MAPRGLKWILNQSFLKDSDKNAGDLKTKVKLFTYSADDFY